MVNFEIKLYHIITLKYTKAQQVKNSVNTMPARLRLPNASVVLGIDSIPSQHMSLPFEGFFSYTFKKSQMQDKAKTIGAIFRSTPELKCLTRLRLYKAINARARSPSVARQCGPSHALTMIHSFLEMF